MKHAWISVLAGAVAFPTAVFGGPQFTAQDIIDHFAKTKKEHTRGAVVIGDPNAPKERGVFIGATGFGNEASATSAAAASSTATASEAPLVIPKTGNTGATTGAAVASANQSTVTIPSTGSTASSASAAAAPAPEASDAYDLLVTFRLGSDELTSQARQNLDQFAVALTDPALADLAFAVDGHTDATGSASYNLALSERRAASVVQYLTSRGVPAKRLVAKGYGETRPLRADPYDPVNRRVETRRISSVLACRATRC